MDWPLLTVNFYTLYYEQNKMLSCYWRLFETACSLHIVHNNCSKSKEKSSLMFLMALTCTEVVYQPACLAAWLSLEGLRQVTRRSSKGFVLVLYNLLSKWNFLPLSRSWIQRKLKWQYEVQVNKLLMQYFKLFKQ